MRQIYAHKALSQLPRLLGNQDRNPFSPTYGCFHRDYWLDKTSDFPDAVRQFAVHALALVYRHNFEGNIYYQQPKIRDWIVAGLDYWASIQHRDGSFDEFYPFERGWVGPTAFTTYTSIEALRLLEGDLPAEVADRVKQAIRKAAYFIAKGESEEDHLANHHAMACLAVWKAYELLDEPALKQGFDRVWQVFLTYHNATEGWSREYDGVDPGYLSATVSFLGKVYQTNPDPAIFEVLKQSVEFSSYFVYPNGFYAGSMGSRNTLHFYPHGYEILADKIPLAGAIAEKMLVALGENKLVPPDIISDRYVVYRVPEFLLCYVDYQPRAAKPAPLPYEREPFTEYFPQSKIFVANRSNHYILANLAKGGVVKVFERNTGQLILNDCGLMGRLDDGRLVTSQWVNPAYQCSGDAEGATVSGTMNAVPSNKLFTPIKNIIFRSVLIALGWSSKFSHMLKGQIRKMLILGQRPVPITFKRHLQLTDNAVTLTDELTLGGEATLTSLSVGDEFFVRYVPQSRYFQAQEFDVSGHHLSAKQIAALNRTRSLTISQRVPLSGTAADIQLNIQTDAIELPEGVYDVDYYYGRQAKPQLVYRLNRRTDEVEHALRTYTAGPLQTIVDVGTADGLMLEKLQERLGSLTFIGLDYSPRLLAVTNLGDINKIQGDAQKLPLAPGIADAIIATAVIEHVPDPAQMLRACHRLLRPNGLLIITTPDSTMEQIATLIGLLKDTGHQETFNLQGLCALCEANQFEVVKASKFMFSPVGFPAEKTIEQLLGPLGLQHVMANQLVVARRLESSAAMPTQSVDTAVQDDYWEAPQSRRHPSDDIIADFVRPKLAYIQQYVTVPPQPTILDVGCGNGYFTHYLHEWGDTIGIDYSSAMLALNPHSHLSKASGYQLPFADNAFDIVVCSNVLHHLDKPQAMLRDMKRVSRQYVVISEPHRNNPAMFLLGMLKPEERSSLHFTKAYVENLAQSVDLTIVASKTMGLITPNRMPRSVVNLIRPFDGPNPIGAYIVMVTRCEK